MKPAFGFTRGGLPVKKLKINKKNIMAEAGQRVVSDCRLLPSEQNCSLVIAGSGDEVLKVATRHAIDEHGHADTPELVEEVKKMIKPE